MIKSVARLAKSFISSDSVKALSGLFPADKTSQPGPFQTDMPDGHGVRSVTSGGGDAGWLVNDFGARPTSASDNIGFTAGPRSQGVAIWAGMLLISSAAEVKPYAASITGTKTALAAAVRASTAAINRRPTAPPATSSHVFVTPSAWMIACVGP